MLFKRIAFGVAALVLAACGQQSAPLPLTPSADSLTPAKAKGPAYGVAIELPDAARRPSGTSATMRSLKATTYIGRKKFVSIVETSVAGCSLSNVAGTATGCQVIVESSTQFDVKKASFSFYKAAKAKGCVLASAKWTGGTTYQYEILAVTFKATNTKKCW